MAGEVPQRPSEDLATRALEVRDYLVAVRGGAPFLSGADDRLLLQWLEQDVPVPLIQAAIDETAERRRKRRAKSRLTLSACRRSVEKSRGGVTPVPKAPPPRASATGLQALADDVALAQVEAALKSPLDQLVTALRTLAATPGPVDEIGRAATAAVARFHAAAWDAVADQHAALRTQAETSLAPLRRGLREADWQAMVEEVARDLVRQRTPAVSARRVWDTLAP